MRHLRSQMQIIFQDPFASLNPRKTVSEIIGEPLRLYKVHKNKKEQEDHVLELMELVGLSDRLVNTYPHELDGGRRQRIGIARALAMKPKFIVCDEPVSALDVSIRSQILNLMKDLQAQFRFSYLFVSHDLSVVNYIGDRIAVMYLGEFVELADKKELFCNPLHPYTQALLSAIPVADVTYKRERNYLEGEVPSPVDPPSGCKFRTRCKYATDLCRTRKPEFRMVSEDHFAACHMQHCV